MKTKYWYKMRDISKKLGFRKHKAKSIAWKCQKIAKDLAKIDFGYTKKEIIKMICQ